MFSSSGIRINIIAINVELTASILKIQTGTLFYFSFCFECHCSFLDRISFNHSVKIGESSWKCYR